MLEIDWTKAPSWANWAAQDEDGSIWFYQEEAINDNHFDKQYSDYWYSSADGFEYKSKLQSQKVNWLESKTERPE